MDRDVSAAGQARDSLAGIDASVSILPCGPARGWRISRAERTHRRLAMHRRQFIGTTLAASVALFGHGRAARGRQRARLRRCRSATGSRSPSCSASDANVIDTAGPWEVFQDVDARGATHHPFELYTVAPTDEPADMTGGLEVKPHYSIENAPAAERHRRAGAQVDRRRRATGCARRARAPTSRCRSAPAPSSSRGRAC